jgi:hypothetical protein
MNMPDSRLAVRLAALGGACGAPEELIGDLIEEIERGRSRAWVCQQLVGLYGFAVMTRVRDRARLTPHVIALAMGVVLLVATAIRPGQAVVAVWLGFYYVMGALSLFAQMATHTIGVPAEAASDAVGD